MLESQNVQERPLGAGQQVFIGAPKRIEPLAHKTATFGVTGPAGPAWSDAPHVRSLHRDLSNERHMSRFESCSFDRNDHLKVLVHVLEWLDASIKNDRMRLGVRSLQIRVANHAIGRTAWTDRMRYTRRPVRVQKGSREGFSWPDAFDCDWPDAPSVRSTLCALLPQHVFDRTTSPMIDRTRRSTWPHPHRALLCHWSDAFGHTVTASGHYQWPSFAYVSIHDDLEKISASGVVENRRFTSTKSAKTHLYRSNYTTFANVLTSPSVHRHVHVC
jgi:hypothetical protein